MTKNQTSSRRLTLARRRSALPQPVLGYRSVSTPILPAGKAQEQIVDRANAGFRFRTSARHPAHVGDGAGHAYCRRQNAKKPFARMLNCAVKRQRFRRVVVPFKLQLDQFCQYG